MAILLALCAALSYGVSDFLGGIASRGWDSRLVTITAQCVAVLMAVIAVAIDGGRGPAAGPMVWGALAGVGTAIGVLSLYRGLARGSVSVVAPVCGVITTVLPALVGIARGNSLTALELVGIVLALPAVALVSREGPSAAGSRAGLGDAILAGVAFGALFVALDQAGSHHGNWPLLTDQVVGIALISPVALRARGQASGASPRLMLFSVLAGTLGGSANLLYVYATHRGELAIVGVLSSLYPAGTVLMARVWLHERWNRLQIAGMLTAILAVVLVAT